MQILTIAVLMLLFSGVFSVIFQRKMAFRVNSVISCALLLFIFGYINSHNLIGESFVFGNFAKEIGIEYKFTRISQLFISTITVVGFYVLILSVRNITQIHTKYLASFTTTAIICSILLSLTNDIFNFYVFFELFSICIYLIFSNTRDIKMKKQTLDYLLLGSVASVFFVLGIEILYIVYNSLNADIIAHTTIALTEKQTIVLKIAVVFIVIASMLKIGVFPFSSWVRNIYTVCPNFCMPFYGTVASMLSIYLVMFFVYRVIGSYAMVQFVSNMVTPFCVITILIFSVLAIKEKDVRVIFGYSTIVQISYIYICITSGNANAIAGGILHIIHNAIVKFGLFCILTQVFKGAKIYTISAMNGLGKNLLLSIPFCILAAGLIGIPATSGFVSKFYMLTGLLEEKKFYIFSVFILGTVLNILYIWPIISAMFFEKPAFKVQTSGITASGIIIAATLCLLFGIFQNFTVGNAQFIATEFLANLKP
jgi:multicomponent Na+:H+ antiporter subunit D